jgi:hypothetical protein
VLHISAISVVTFFRHFSTNTAETMSFDSPIDLKKYGILTIGREMVDGAEVDLFVLFAINPVAFGGFSNPAR